MSMCGCGQKFILCTRSNFLQIEQIRDLLERINGCTFAGLDSLTQVSLRGGRRNPQLGRVTKWCYGSRVMLFTNKNSSGYVNMVRRRLEKEGKDPMSYIPGQLAWGRRVYDSPLIQHEGKDYLQVIFLKPGTTEYFLDGEPIAKEDIKWLPPEE